MRTVPASRIIRFASINRSLVLQPENERGTGLVDIDRSPSFWMRWNIRDKPGGSLSCKKRSRGNPSCIGTLVSLRMPRLLAPRSSDGASRPPRRSPKLLLRYRPTLFRPNSIHGRNHAQKARAAQLRWHRLDLAFLDQRLGPR